MRAGDGCGLESVLLALYVVVWPGRSGAEYSGLDTEPTVCELVVCVGMLVLHDCGGLYAVVETMTGDRRGADSVSRETRVGVR